LPKLHLAAQRHQRRRTRRGGQRRLQRVGGLLHFLLAQERMNEAGRQLCIARMSGQTDLIKTGGASKIGGCHRSIGFRRSVMPHHAATGRGQPLA
jgi:hypothetical protein